MSLCKFFQKMFESKVNQPLVNERDSATAATIVAMASVSNTAPKNSVSLSSSPLGGRSSPPKLENLKNGK